MRPLVRPRPRRQARGPRLPLPVLPAALLALLAPLLVLAPAAAQEFAVRAGAGAATAGGEVGFSALLAPEITLAPLVLRAEARTVLTGASADYAGSARLITVGVAAGLASPRSAAGLRAYGLGSVAFGADPREGDRATVLAAALGADLGSRPGPFAELRYEGWIQTGVRYHDLPSGALSLILGLRVP